MCISAIKLVAKARSFIADLEMDPDLPALESCWEMLAKSLNLLDISPELMSTCAGKHTEAVKEVQVGMRSLLMRIFAPWVTDMMALFEQLLQQAAWTAVAGGIGKFASKFEPIGSTLCSRLINHSSFAKLLPSECGDVSFLKNGLLGMTLFLKTAFDAFVKFNIASEKPFGDALDALSRDRSH